MAKSQFYLDKIDFLLYRVIVLLFMFLLILSMLTDRAGCYNVREKKLIVLKLTSTVNSYGIATFSVRGEGLRS